MKETTENNLHRTFSSNKQILKIPKKGGKSTLKMYRNASLGDSGSDTNDTTDFELQDVLSHNNNNNNNNSPHSPMNIPASPRGGCRYCFGLPVDGATCFYCNTSYSPYVFSYLLSLICYLLSIICYLLSLCSLFFFVFLIL